jgi:dolichyl-phosphate beta-glucosyltransferase
MVIMIIVIGYVYKNKTLIIYNNFLYNMTLSVVIPAYNESKRIKKTLIDIISYLESKKCVYEIIIVDDSSFDNTIQVVNSLKNKNIQIIKNKTNHGKGFCVKRGIKNSKYDFILFSDADLATPIKELDSMIKEINNGFDIVVASRNLSKSIIMVEQPFYRQIMGKIFPLIVRLLLIPQIKDTQCGFKLFRSNIAKKIVKKQTINRFCFDVEILFIAKKYRYKIKEVPVTWIDKKGSKVNPFKDSFSMFFDLIKIRINDLLGKYRK